MTCSWCCVVLVALLVLNGSICSFCRVDVMEEVTGNCPGTSGICAGLAKGVESLREYLSCLYVLKDCSGCRKGELPPGLSVV